MAYGRIYRAVLPPTAVAAIEDLIRVTAAAGHILVIHEVSITQTTLETDEQLPIILQRSSSPGTSGTTITPVPMMAGDPAFGGTAAADFSANTTQTDILYREGFNLKSGFFWLPPPELRIVVPPSGIFVVHLPTAPAASTTFTGGITFEVIGGA